MVTSWSKELISIKVCRDEVRDVRARSRCGMQYCWTVAAAACNTVVNSRYGMQYCWPGALSVRVRHVFEHANEAKSGACNSSEKHVHASCKCAGESATGLLMHKIQITSKQEKKQTRYTSLCRISARGTWRMDSSWTVAFGISLFTEKAVG